MYWPLYEIRLHFLIRTSWWCNTIKIKWHFTSNVLCCAASNKNFLESRVWNKQLYIIIPRYLYSRFLYFWNQFLTFFMALFGSLCALFGYMFGRSLLNILFRCLEGQIIKCVQVMICSGILWRGIFQFGKIWKYFKETPIICLFKLQCFLLV